MSEKKDSVNSDGLIGDVIKTKLIDKKEGETFAEMCDRLGLDPRCTCTFGLDIKEGV